MKRTIPILRIATIVALTLVFTAILFGDEKDGTVMSYVMFFIIAKVLLFISASVVFLCLRWKAAVTE